MKYQRGFISESDFWWFIATIGAIGFVFGGVVFIGIPKLWEFLKPFIHLWTA